MVTASNYWDNIQKENVRLTTVFGEDRDLQYSGKKYDPAIKF